MERVNPPFVSAPAAVEPKSRAALIERKLALNKYIQLGFTCFGAAQCRIRLTEVFPDQELERGGSATLWATKQSIGHFSAQYWVLRPRLWISILADSLIRKFVFKISERETSVDVLQGSVTHPTTNR
ncbi:unnamed protein product [Blepharisma stoltei]|uniref:Uncharacterized protein n=1 Tax=Blepharisma stoltei TaxID=1481888 RepID=A0AAU9JTY8_9CILI|nr:unnamed protein product [Blepharisma stoltei]